MQKMTEATKKDDAKVNVRELVWQILVEHERRGTYTNLLIKRTQDRYESLPLTQRSFLKRLAEGTLERSIELDHLIAAHVSDPSIKRKPEVTCLLRMSLYQILYMDSVPDYAACNEAVRICKRKSLSGSASFVNGLLRTVCREKAAALAEGREYPPALPVKKPVRTRPSSATIVIAGKKKGPDAQSAFAGSGENANPQLQQLSVRYSMPMEILELWEEQLGMERLDPLCRAMLQVRPVCIRLHPQLTAAEKEELLEDIRKTGAQLAPGKWAEDCYLLTHIPGLAGLPGFAEGKWTVQDESSQLVAEAAGLAGRRRDLSGRQQVYDLCAAPGGKTVLAAMLLPEAQVHAYDLTREKTDRIRSALGRMKLHNVTVEENDASNKRADFKEQADLVLCDVPCSGLGIMTRKRDIKYNVNAQKLRSLVTLQKKIAASAADVVKPGGILLYSTCTIHRRENEKMAEFIERQLGLLPESLEPYLPEHFPGVEGNHVQLFPDLHGTDGFFMARFRKPM